MRRLSKRRSRRYAVSPKRWCDGEGATKLVTYKVTGAVNHHEAEIAAKALSNSLLVKTALFGEDPNWGRIASTVGASGIMCDEAFLSIWFDDVCVYRKGELLFDETIEPLAAAVMKKSAFTIHCDIGLQDGTFTASDAILGTNTSKSTPIIVRSISNG